MTWSARGFPYQEHEARRKVDQIGSVVMVGSGKGGVGKSFVASGLALSLAGMARRTGVLDVDIHGASLPSYLRVRPPLRTGRRGIEPKRSGGVKVMSVALFTGQNPVPMRGDAKESLITQLVALTDWGPLDYLVVDLPPSMGDELLSAFRLFGGKSRFLLVTTPSPNALSVVARLRRLIASERIPLEGVVLNMAYASERRGRSYPFGVADASSVRKVLRADVIAELPLEPAVNSESLVEVLRKSKETSTAFKALADRVVRGP